MHIKPRTFRPRPPAYRITVAILASLLLAACAVGPDFQKPATTAPGTWSRLPSQVQNRDKDLPSLFSAQSPDTEWWKRFQDPLLTALVKRALKENLSLQNASTLVAQSRALRVAAGADQFPMLNGNGSYTRIAPSKNGILSLAKTLSGGGNNGSMADGSGQGSIANGTGIGAVKYPASGIQPFNLYQYGFDASWEVDLWGRVRREMESAEASLDASRAAHHGAQLSIIAEVARNYIELRRLQARRELAGQRLTAARELLDLARQQAGYGVTTAIEVEAAQSALASIEAELPNLDQQVALTINQLGVLLSQPPGILNAELTPVRPVPAVPAMVRIGLPSGLAERRPDIREAAARLHAALAEIGQATAEFYPRVTLSGSAGFQSLRLKDLGNWSSLQYAAGPSIMLPIFQGGRLLATLELRQAEHQQAAIGFHNTVLNAWHEVDNALSAYQQAQQRLQSLTETTASQRESHALFRQRFQSGVITYQPVLEAIGSLLEAEQASIDQQASIATDLIAVYKSIGGGWQPFQEQIDPDEADKKAQTP